MIQQWPRRTDRVGMTEAAVSEFASEDLPPGDRPVVALIGPSSPLKTTVVDTLARIGALRVHPTWTTRPAKSANRPGDPRTSVSDAMLLSAESEGKIISLVENPGASHRLALPRFERSEVGPVDAVSIPVTMLDDLRSTVGEVIVYQIEGEWSATSDYLRRLGHSGSRGVVRVDAYLDQLKTGAEIADRRFVDAGTLGSPDELTGRIIGALRDDLARSGYALPLDQTVGAPPWCVVSAR